GLAVRGLRDRRVRSSYCRLARQHLDDHGLRLDALERALYARRPGDNGTLTDHSDRGSQTSAFDTANGWPKRASNRRSVAAATVMRTPWRKRLTACTRLN